MGVSNQLFCDGLQHTRSISVWSADMPAYDIREIRLVSIWKDVLVGGQHNVIRVLMHEYPLQSVGYTSFAQTSSTSNRVRVIPTRIWAGGQNWGQ